MFPYCSPPPVNSQDSLQAALLIDRIWITVPVRLPNVTSLKISSAENGVQPTRHVPFSLKETGCSKFGKQELHQVLLYHVFKRLHQPKRADGGVSG